MKRYHDSLIKSLKDPAEAAEYLNAVLEDGNNEMFLVALKNVAEARGGMAKLSHTTRFNRANLYRTFSKVGNPEIHTLTSILNNFGLRLAIATKSKQRSRAA